MCFSTPRCHVFKRAENKVVYQGTERMHSGRIYNTCIFWEPRVQLGMSQVVCFCSLKLLSHLFGQCVGSCVCVCACVRACVHMCVCACARVCTRACACVCTCMCLYVHVYLGIQKQKGTYKVYIMSWCRSCSYC